MREPVLYMRGFGSDPATNPHLAKDLERLLSIDVATLSVISETLANCSGFLDSRTLLSHLQQFISDQETSKSIRRILRNLNRDSANSITDTFAAIPAEEGPPFSPAQIDDLRPRLTALFRQPIPALLRQRKAETLARLLPNPAESIEILCDIRPVFDESREHVQGLIPFTVLRIVTTNEDGLPVLHETHLSAQQLDDLASKADKASRKLRSLREFTRQHLPEGLPAISLTPRAKRLPDNNFSMSHPITTQLIGVI